MDHNERTRDIFEHIGDYEKPPQIPLLELTAESAFRSLNIRRTHYSEVLLWIAANFTGFKSWYKKKLPSQLDELLLKTDLRGAALQAPAVSAAISLKDDERGLDVFDRAVTLVLAVQRFYKDMISGELPPDKYKDAILEMGQYRNLFSTSLTIDHKKPRLFKSSRTDQMTVVVNDRIYLVHLDFCDEINHSILKNTLQAIAGDAEVDDSSSSGAGLLTTTPHPIQIKAFSRIQANEENRKNIEALRHSFVTLCLDLDKEPIDDAEVLNIAHSGNPRNRWYWSALQLVVFGNAKASSICNFSAYLDGNTMMRGSAAIQARAEKIELSFAGTKERYSFIKLNWNIAPEAFERAKEFFEKFKDEQRATHSIENIGRKAFEAQNIDPIAAFVVALKMAADTYIYEAPSIHQFLTMTKYRYMDLVTALVSTQQVASFCDYVKNEDYIPQKAKELLLEALKSQRESCRHERSAMQIMTAFSLFLSTRRSLQKVKDFGIYMICLNLLRKKQYLKPSRRDIVISHPAIQKEAPLVGRPGVKLPYVTYFALHYQMWADKTVITMMPGMNWKIANKDFVCEIGRNLQIMLDISATPSTIKKQEQE